jgi:hypothetical protein
MIFKKFIIASTVILLSISSISRPGWAADPITDAMLDKADSTAKDIIARAEAAGNAVAKAIGEQLRQSIQALREAIHSSINDAKDAYLQSERDTYDNITKGLDQVKDIEKISMTDITATLANLSNEVGSLPFINLPPSVMLYQPHVMVPQGNSEIPVHVIGPKLASSEPVVTFNGAPVALQKPRDVELIAVLDRKALKFDEIEPHYLPVHIKFDRAQATWWKPWTWAAHDVIDRDMTLLLLPEILGRYTISTKLNQTNYEYKNVGRTAGGRGKDAPMDRPIGLDPPEAKDGWKIDVAKLTKDGLKFSTLSQSGGSSCTGLQNDTLTENGFNFRLQHGHETDWAGHKSDGDVQCAFQIPLVKATQVIVEGPTLKGNIGWLKDVRQSFPADMASHVLALQLFNGKEYLIDSTNKTPYDVIEITRDKDFVQFRPKPPADF